MRTVEQRELAARVLKRITEHPESWDQEMWFHDRREHRVALDSTPVSQVAEWVKAFLGGAPVEACRATACVAGWTVVLEYLDKPCASSLSVPDEAKELLGLSYREMNWLFHWNRSFEEVTDALRTLADGEELSVPCYWEDDL